MATRVRKHLASPAGSYGGPDRLGLKEQQPLGFNCLPHKENVSAFTREESCADSQSKHAPLLWQFKFRIKLVLHSRRGPRMASALYININQRVPALRRGR